MFRPGMTNRDGRMPMQQQQCHRLPNDVTATDHNGLLSTNINPAAIEEFNHTGRRTGGKWRPCLNKAANIKRMKSINVFFDINRIKYLLLSISTHALR